MIAVRPNLINAGSSTHDVLRLLHEHGPQRQGEIAGHLGISKAACNLHFRKLADDGLIEVSEELINGRGAPSQVWRLSDDNNYFMGVLFFSRTISVTVIDFSDNIVANESIEISDPANSVKILAELEWVVNKVYREVRRRNGRIFQTFISGPVIGALANDGTCLYCHYLPGLEGVNLEKELYRLFGLNTYCDTNHYAVMQGETRNLPPKVTSLLLTWEEGVSCIITANNQILNFAGVPASRNRGLWNTGHIPIVKGGRPCYCGLEGCLETYVGGRALLNELPECRNLNELIRKIQDGNPRALNAVNAAAELLASSLYWPIELFGVDTIIVIGDFSTIFDKFKDSFMRGLAQMREQEALDKIQVRPSIDTITKMRLGAALMARHFFFYPDEPRKCRGVYHLPKEHTTVQTTGVQS